MVVAERVFRLADLPAAASALARDTVTLGWEARTHVHGRRRTDGGVEFGTSLPRGTVLREGDYLLLEPAHLLVAIVERPEPVFIVSPRTPREWALFAYHIGNRHQPLMLEDDGILCPEVAGMEQLLQQHRMPYARATRPFTPAVARAGH